MACPCRRVYFDSVREYLVPPDRRGRNVVGFERVAARAAAPPPAPAPISAVNSASGALLDRLRDFYSDKDNFEKLRGYLERGRGSPVSLRILDFLCTENGIALQSDDALPEKYQHMLKTYSKGFFDMFARGAKTTIELNGERLQTTVGQLNYFRWAIQTGLLGRVQAEQTALREGVKKRRREETEKPMKARAPHVRIGGRFEPRVFPV